MRSIYEYNRAVFRKNSLVFFYVIFKGAGMEKEAIIDLIRRIDFFRQIPEVQAKKLIELGKIKKYNANDIIVKEGEISSNIYFLLSGGFMVTAQGKIVHYENNYGEFFGDIAAIDKLPRTAFVRANKESLFFVLNINDVLPDQSELSTGERFYLNICQTFSERLRKNDLRIRQLNTEIAKLEKAVGQ